jgi:hypothetical protein
MIKEAGLYNKISQAYAGLVTQKMVGVMVLYCRSHQQRETLTVYIKGDKRQEGYLILLRAVVTTDFMTAEGLFAFLSPISGPPVHPLICTSSDISSQSSILTPSSSTPSRGASSTRW